MAQKNTLQFSMPMLEYFDQIYIINLASRQDRLLEMQAELNKIGVDFNHPKIHVFTAIKPESHDGWPTAGTKGCYLSHLGVLKDAQDHHYQRILILEDDVSFTQYFDILMGETITQLKNYPWDIFYGGYRVEAPVQEAIIDAYQHSQSLSKNLFLSLPETEIFCLHCVALTGPTIAKLVDYLEKIMAKPMGDPTGGRMHVDGAYNWFRKEHSHIATLLAYPQLAHQRSSRTDIHDLKWFDTLPIFKSAASAARKVKNMVL